MNGLKLAFVFNRKKRLNKKGLASIQLRIHAHYKSRYLATGLCVAPAQWDSDKQRVVKHPNAMRYNFRLKELETAAEAYYLDQIRAGKIPTALEVRNHLTGGPEKENYLDWLAAYIEKKQCAKATQLNMRLLIKYLKAYRHHISPSELDYNFIRSFDAFLHRQKTSKNKSLSINYIAKLHIFNRAALSEAVRQDYVKSNPYGAFSIKTVKVNRETITIKEIDLLLSKDLSQYTTKQRSGIKAFLFACLTTLRYSDIIAGPDPEHGLRVKHIKITQDDVRLQKLMYKKRNSTPKFYDISLRRLFDGRPANLILPMLRGKGPEDFIFEHTTNGSVNTAVKNFVKAAGIDAYLTMHCARKSAAQNLLDAGANKTAVQALMMHSSQTTTEVYANNLRSKALDDHLENLSYN